METPLGRQTLHCDNCYLITAGKHSHSSPFFQTVSTLWESKYFSDYPGCALIHMVHSVCHHRCYTPRIGFQSRKSYPSTSCGWFASCCTMNTQRSRTISHRGQCQSFIKLPSYLIFCHHPDMRGYLFHLCSGFSGDYALKIKGVYT